MYNFVQRELKEFCKYRLCDPIIRQCQGKKLMVPMLVAHIILCEVEILLYVRCWSEVSRQLKSCVLNPCDFIAPKPNDTSMLIRVTLANYFCANCPPALYRTIWCSYVGQDEATTASVLKGKS